MHANNNPIKTLRVGMVGSGFIANFHLQAMTGVRNVEVTGVYSPTAAHRRALAEKVARMDLGRCIAYDSLEDLVCAPNVDAIWILCPNDARLPVMRTIHRLVKDGAASLSGIACEKPLARTISEAREFLALGEDVGINHGYLENQVFSTAVQRGKEIIWKRAVPSSGRPYLARAAEEHSGPHEPWFWQGKRQGGGVLSDMMCHSVEVARFMLAAPGEHRSALELVSANATIGHLKWTRPEYVKLLKERMGAGVDYAIRPAEDFARGTLVLRDPQGREVIIETTTSWAYVGAGLRIQLELLGPEYAMEFSSLNTGLKLFLSRNVTGSEGEDLVEKQNAEQGLMPVVEDEAGIYGYTSENRHMVDCFRNGTTPIETWHDGVDVVRILMALYRSAEIGQTMYFPVDDLEDYVPPVAREG